MKVNHQLRKEQTKKEIRTLGIIAGVGCICVLIAFLAGRRRQT